MNYSTLLTHRSRYLSGNEKWRYYRVPTIVENVSPETIEPESNGTQIIMFFDQDKYLSRLQRMSAKAGEIEKVVVTWTDGSEDVAYGGE